MGSTFEDDDSEDSSLESERDVPWVSEVREVMGEKKDCWNTCDYPSECRWGKQYGVHTPVVVSAPPPPLIPLLPPAPPTTVLETTDGLLKIETPKGEAGNKNEKGAFWGALMASATRRKSSVSHSSSPLASLEPVAEEPEAEEEEESAMAKDNDGDVVMSSPTDTTFSTAASAVSATLTALTPDTVKNLVRRTSRRGSRAREAAERKRRNAVLYEEMPPSPTTTDLRDIEFQLALESDNEGDVPMAPLERVKSRDSGYCSSMGGGGGDKY